MSGAWRSLVARVLWELPIIQTKSIAITRLRLNITIYLVRVSEEFFKNYFYALTYTELLVNRLCRLIQLCSGSSKRFI